MTPGKAYMTSDEIRPLAERSDLLGALLVVHCWAVIAAALAVFALWPNPLTAGSPPASRRAAAIQSDFMNQNHLLLHEAQVRNLASLSRRDSR